MSNFFSARFWRALYFRAMGGQASALDPNAMSGQFAGAASFSAAVSAIGALSGQFAGSSSVEGTLTGVANDGAMSGSFVGAAAFAGTLSFTQTPVEQFQDTHDGRKRRPVYDQDTLLALARAEDEADKARREKERQSKLDLQRILGRALGEPEPPPPKPIAPPVAIVAAPEPQQPATSRNNPQQADALALRQKEDDDAIIILLLAA
jgi:hypothetical protein